MAPSPSLFLEALVQESRCFGTTCQILANSRAAYDQAGNPSIPRSTWPEIVLSSTKIRFTVVNAADQFCKRKKKKQEKQNKTKTTNKKEKLLLM